MFYTTNEFFSSVLTGIKKGYNTPTLPKNILQFIQNPIVRVFRVLGGISVILLITNRLIFLGDEKLYFISLVICVILFIMFSIYQIFITYHRIKYMIKVFKSEELDVRN